MDKEIISSKTTKKNTSSIDTVKPRNKESKDENDAKQDSLNFNDDIHVESINKAVNGGLKKKFKTKDTKVDESMSKDSAKEVSTQPIQIHEDKVITKKKTTKKKTTRKKTTKKNK